MSTEEQNGSSLDITDGQELQTSDLDTKSESPTEIIEKPVFKEDETEVTAEDGFEGEINQELHNMVLEKLDINPRQKIEQEKVERLEAVDKIPTSDKQRAEDSSFATIQVEKAIADDFSKIQKLMQAGLINSTQEQNLKKQVLKKAFDKLVQTEKIRRTLSPVQIQNQAATQQRNDSLNRNEVFEEFSKTNPEFFASDGRKEVLNYLKSDNLMIGKDELSKISGIIRIVEKAAIEGYLKKVTHEKTLRSSNEAAKQRLTANAQKSSSSGNLLRTFTREQIGKMSSAEFAKYESSIMEQLKKGQIR